MLWNAAMTKIALLLAAGAAALPGVARAQACVGDQVPGAARLTVEAVGLRNGAGEIAFTVYPDDRRRFLAKGGKLLRARVRATAPVTRACFLLRPGSYAVALYHDENVDRNFNRTLFAPNEGFGFSNDAPTSIGLPSLAAARFTVSSGGRTMRMRVRYRR
jgi:uncharacterized protein (DUF2141 family)